MRPLVPLASLAVLAWPTLAHATTDAGACNAPVIAPVPGEIPANLPYFVVARRGNDVADLALVREDGSGGVTIVPSAVEPEPLFPDSVRLVTSEPLVAGERYHVRFGECLVDPDRRWPDAEYVVGDAIPLPTTLGTVQLSELQRFVDGGAEYTYVDVTLVPSAEMAPWLSVHALDLTAATPSGPLQRPGAPERRADGTARWRLEVDCGPASREPPYSLAPGDAMLSVTARGPAGELSAEAAATLVCDEAVVVVPGMDGGVLADGGPAVASRGCSVGAGRAGAGPAIVVLAALARTVMRRVRRRARTHG